MHLTDTEADKKSENALNYGQIFGLSATTPTFYPRQTADSSDLIQMVSAVPTQVEMCDQRGLWAHIRGTCEYDS